jgi:hypothetical protein
VLFSVKFVRFLDSHLSPISGNKCQNFRVGVEGGEDDPPSYNPETSGK